MIQTKLFKSHKTTKISALALLLLVCLIATPSARAEQAKTVKFKVSSYIHKIMLSPVGDKPGHAIGFFSRRGLAFLENNEMATYTNRGTLDLVKGNGTFEGYSTLEYTDQSKTVQKFQGIMKNTKGIISLEGSGIYVKGTGRFDGISGDFTFKCQALTPYNRELKAGSEFFCDAVGHPVLPSRPE